MLGACHERVRRSLLLLVRLQAHLAQRGADDEAKNAAQDILRYFSVAAPAHHMDEERHIVPTLLQSEDPEHVQTANRMLLDHIRINSAWRGLEPLLREVEAGQAPQARDLAAASDLFLRLHDDHLGLEDGIAFPVARKRVEAAGDNAVAAMGEEMASRRRVPRIT